VSTDNLVVTFKKHERGLFSVSHHLCWATNGTFLSSMLLPLISGITTLEELDLSRCSRVTNADLEHLLSLPNLKMLSISETGFQALAWLDGRAF